MHTASVVWWIERRLGERKVGGSIPCNVIPKDIRWYAMDELWSFWALFFPSYFSLKDQEVSYLINNKPGILSSDNLVILFMNDMWRQ